MKTLISRKTKKESGFTLVELMIVVAIIGILASIAIPNYQKYQAKSRTSEAKIYLSGAFTAEKSFVVEYSSFTGCLNAAGFAADTSQRYYAVGFLSASATGTTCGQTGASSCVGNLGTNAPTCTDGVDVTFFNAQNKVFSGATTATQSDLAGSALATSSFTVTAAGAIHPSATTKDVWTITDQKALSQTAVGY